MGKILVCPRFGPSVFVDPSFVFSNCLNCDLDSGECELKNLNDKARELKKHSRLTGNVKVRSHGRSK